MTNVDCLVSHNNKQEVFQNTLFNV